MAAMRTTAVAKAREQWKAAKGAGCQVTYWQQSGEGRWEKKLFVLPRLRGQGPPDDAADCKCDGRCEATRRETDDAAQRGALPASPSGA